MRKTKVIVTGGSGFLGKAVNKVLKDNLFYDVVSLEGKRDYDLTNQKQVDYLYKGHEPDVIVHLAARVGGIGANKDNPGLFMYENLVMGMNLIETARKYGKLQKFVMVGTVCAYPKFTPVPFKEEDIWNGYPEETNAPYGIAKKALMELLIAYEKQYKFNSTNLIPVNMYGPHDNFDPSISHVIPALILKIATAMKHGEKRVELWGTGQASREFLFVDDCAEAITKSISIDTGPDPINIGTGQEIKICDLVREIAEQMGYEGEIVYDKSKPDGQPRRCLDTSKAKEKLDFEAKTDLQHGLVKTIEWFLKESKIDY